MPIVEAIEDIDLQQEWTDEDMEDLEEDFQTFVDDYYGDRRIE